MHRSFVRGVRAACVFLAIALGGIAVATASASDRILVTTNATPFPYAYSIYDYAFDGTLLRERAIPSHNGDTARDVVQLWGESLGLYHGTFSPLVRTLDRSGQWRSHAVPGLSVPNNGTYGGIAYQQGRLYVGDLFTHGGEAAGIVRIDLRTGAWQRFDSAGYIDLSMGLDGKLYGLRDMYGALDVIDPATMAVLRTHALGHTSSSRAVAADSDGTIYMASWDRYIAKYNADGVRQATLNLLSQPLFDIDIDRDGRIVASDWSSEIWLTDTALSAPTHFDAGVPSSDGAFVAFFTPTPDALAVDLDDRVASLSWTSGAAEVDVYRNGTRVWRGANTHAHAEILPRSAPRKGMRYAVCNAGTDECGAPVFAAQAPSPPPAAPLPDPRKHAKRTAPAKTASATRRAPAR